ncbi:metal ABC transporter substrate-binding protein, partial [Porticoccaceae bacterium]|nr:metal ABC transporter substrate-binding protein [Porticoccaceae bacterium]
MKEKIQYNVLSLPLVLSMAMSTVGGSFASAQSAESSLPVVITTIKPLAIIAKSALGDSANVEYLQSGAQSAHDLSLQVSALRKINQADLVIWIGEDFESRVAKNLQALPTSKLMTVLDLPIKHLDAGEDKNLGKQGTHQSHLTTDPHVWL